MGLYIRRIYVFIPRYIQFTNIVGKYEMWEKRVSVELFFHASMRVYIFQQCTYILFIAQRNVGKHCEIYTQKTKTKWAFGWLFNMYLQRSPHFTSVFCALLYIRRRVPENVIRLVVISKCLFSPLNSQIGKYILNNYMY